MPWAIKWRSENKMDGKREFLIGRWFSGYQGEVPANLDGHTIAVFRTREDARKHCRKYGYIKNRPDLKAEPHGWKSAQVVKVKVTVEEVE